MTRRERLEAKAARRREWAASRERHAAGKLAQAHQMADVIPFGQPILVGHHSEKRDRAYRGRIEGAYRAGFESQKMAEHHDQKAAGIETQLERSIFSDDPDAAEALGARIVELTAERDRIKAFNAAVRKSGKVTAEALLLITADERADLLVTARVASYQLSKGGGFPAYKLSNLGAEIRRNRERMKEVHLRATRTARAEEASDGCHVGGTERWAVVTFAEKPERAVLDALKGAGFRWQGGSWHGPRDRLPEGIDA